MQKFLLLSLILFNLTLIKQQFYDEEVVCQEYDNSCYDDYDIFEQYELVPKKRESDESEEPELEYQYEDDYEIA